MTNYNTGENGLGAIGYRGKIARTVDWGLKIAKFDIVTEELIRDKNGRCIEVSPHTNIFTKTFRLTESA